MYKISTTKEKFKKELLKTTTKNCVSDRAYFTFIFGREHHTPLVDSKGIPSAQQGKSMPV